MLMSLLGKVRFFGGLWGLWMRFWVSVSCNSGVWFLQLFMRCHFSDLLTETESYHLWAALVCLFSVVLPKVLTPCLLFLLPSSSPSPSPHTVLGLLHPLSGLWLSCMVMSITSVSQTSSLPCTLDSYLQLASGHFHWDVLHSSAVGLSLNSSSFPSTQLLSLCSLHWGSVILQFHEASLPRERMFFKPVCLAPLPVPPL